MAMTDGHIFLDTHEQKKSRHPAVSLTVSVSRVGNQTVGDLERQVAYRLHQLIAQARKAEELGRFGVDLAEPTMELIRNTAKLETLFNQDADVTFSKELQLVYVGLFLSGYWNGKTADEMAKDVEDIRVASEQGKLDALKLQIGRVSKLSEYLSIIVANHLNITKMVNGVKKQK